MAILGSIAILTDTGQSPSRPRHVDIICMISITHAEPGENALIEVRPVIGIVQIISPLVVGLVLVALGSLLKEPTRQRFSAIFVAGAGAAYLSGGFGVAEFGFCAAMTYVAYRGLTDYRMIGLAWLMHTAWDVAHHFYGNPIIPFAPLSSFGCALCDPIIAIWYFLGAPSLLGRHLPTTPS